MPCVDPRRRVARTDVEVLEQQLRNPLEETLLVADVAVQRHALHAEGRPELAHAQRIEAIAIDQGQRRSQDALPCESRSRHRRTSLRCKSRVYDVNATGMSSVPGVG